MTGLRLSEERRKRVAGAEKHQQYLLLNDDANEEEKCSFELLITALKMVYASVTFNSNLQV